MATKTPDVESAAPPKSKKMLVLVALLLVVALAAAGGWFYLSKKNAALDEENEDEAPAAVAQPQGPPTYLPLENMVVNLADPGGERVAQVGITLELSGATVTDKVKAYLPTIRSEILMLVSQRTADELLKREGKEQLAADILAAASLHFGKPAAEGKKKSKKSGNGDDNGPPIRGVLFSSFIVQ